MKLNPAQVSAITSLVTCLLWFVGSCLWAHFVYGPDGTVSKMFGRLAQYPVWLAIGMSLAGAVWGACVVHFWEQP